MIGKALGDELAEHPLDGDVDLGDQIDGALLVDAEVAAEPRHHGVAGADDGLDGGGEEQRIARGNHWPTLFTSESMARALASRLPMGLPFLVKHEAACSISMA